ncbi:MAG TPA: N-acetyltransferase [Anaerolineae bacterium]|nr:N-acetyltransferase [Anaerolineae bacterium]
MTNARANGLWVQPVTTEQDRRVLVRFPWRVYRNDPQWVPPLIHQRERQLDPERGSFFGHGEAAPFLARRGDEVVGTVVAWINHRSNSYLKEKAAGFGFFEVLEDYPTAEALLTAACDWARGRGMEVIRGPFYFSMDDSPGVLIKGFDQPQVVLTGHTPPYYAAFIERFGMEKYRDAYAYRGDLAPLKGDMANVPRKILRVAEAVRRREKVTIRQLQMDDWDNEVALAMEIFNQALGHMRNHVPMDETEFRRFADDLRVILDPDMVLFAEVAGQPVGFSVTVPDINRALRHVNGRLSPLGLLKLWWYRRRINVASFKILGVLEEYRGRGIDALFYVETASRLLAKGYEWIDLSLVAENNVMMNRLVQRLGGYIYRHYRTYQKAL